MRKLMTGVVVGALLAVVATPVQGQVAWDSPFMVAPNTPAGWGVYLVDPSPGDGIGVLTTFRSSSAPGGLGYRLGLAEGAGDDLAVYGGLDASGFLLRRSGDFPLDVAWVTGLGLGAGDDVLVSFPLGAALGRDFQADGVWFNPYLGPRVVLDAWFGDGSDMDLRLSVDLGVDVSFDPGWAVRFAGSLGDREGLAIGLSFRVF